MSRAPVPAIAPTRAVAAVVAPATSRSRAVSSVVAPATSRSRAATPAPRVVSPPAPAPAWTATADVGDASPLAPARKVAAAQTDASDVGSAAPRRPARETPARSVPENAPFVSRARRRDDSLVSRVRRRQANVAEAHEESVAPHVDEGVTVISRTHRRDRPLERRAPEAAMALESGPVWGATSVAPTPDVRPDLGLASAARKTAVMVGSRAREALLGYPFPAADPGASAPYAGEEPAPGQTVVLVGDDVEAWVRERLYGGRLPSR